MALGRVSLANERQMRQTILIGGGTGLVGTRLLEMIDFSKYKVHILSRSKKPDTEDINYFTWDFRTMTIEDGATDVDYIINLTGAGIADQRWTDSRKKILIDSRVNSAKLIQQSIQKSKVRPKAFISASAIGYYGDRADELLTETSPSGDGFMSTCCRAWEESAMLVSPLVDRHVIHRIGIVLSTDGGALPKILMTKAVGVYNYFGDGSQYYSWIHIEDLCNIFLSSIEDDSMTGIYNVVAPTPLTNKRFTTEIKDALGGVVALSAPKFALRLLLGEMANVVLNSNRVVPDRLTKVAYPYQFTDLGEAVKDLIKRGI